MEYPTLLDELIEIVACAEAIRRTVLPLIAKEEQKEGAKLRKRRQRMHAPTRNPLDAA